MKYNNISSIIIMLPIPVVVLVISCLMFPANIFIYALALAALLAIIAIICSIETYTFSDGLLTIEKPITRKRLQVPFEEVELKIVVGLYFENGLIAVSPFGMHPLKSGFWSEGKVRYERNKIQEFMT